MASAVVLHSRELIQQTNELNVVGSDIWLEFGQADIHHT